MGLGIRTSKLGRTAASPALFFSGLDDDLVKLSANVDLDYLPFAVDEMLL
jgi:hypothetical protein